MSAPVAGAARAGGEWVMWLVSAVAVLFMVASVGIFVVTGNPGESLTVQFTLTSSGVMAAAIVVNSVFIARMSRQVTRLREACLRAKSFDEFRRNL